METVKLIAELYFRVFFEVIILGLLPLLGQDSGEQTGKHWAEKGGISKGPSRWVSKCISMSALAAKCRHANAYHRAVGADTSE